MTQPKTTIDLLRQASDELLAVSDSPRLDAEVLLSHVTGHSRAHFFAWPDETLADEQVRLFHQLQERRLAGEPVAHIIGTREFWSREFRVSADVLIPRPETELLVEWALELMPHDQALRIADLGSGSGALAVTLALERPRAEVLAVDVSEPALAIAMENARRLGAGNVRFLHSDWFAALPRDSRFDLIVSNPPYIAEHDPHLSQGDVRFEPSLALSSGPDGLNAIRLIVAQAPAYLLPGAWLLFEHGYDQGEAARDLLHSAGFVEVATRRDGSDHERVSGGRCP